MNHSQAKIIGIAGWKNSGKTTLMENLITEFDLRGYSVCAIKHAHHRFDIDKEGKDSYRFRQAGAKRTTIVSANRWAMIHELHSDDEPSLAEVIATTGETDLIFVEGYKWESHPKIEVRNTAEGQPKLLGDVPNIIAIAWRGEQPHADVPLFGVDRTGEIADFISDFLDLAR